MASPLRIDEQTYRRAAQAALLGLAAQSLLLVVMLLTAFWASSRNLVGESLSLFSASYHMIGGLLVWSVLWMVFNQHRLERLEGIESEQMARSDAQLAALFDEHAEDLQVARKRLQNMYRYGINGVSIALVVYYLAVGGSMIWRALGLARNPLYWTPVERAQDHSTTLLVMTILMAFVSFVSARYVAGMTKVKEWSMLRGGAGYLMASALASVLGFAAALSASLGRPALWTYLGVLMAGLLLVTGFEIAMSFLLGAYRPRKPGETPRPAFESRLLGWLTAPESIAKIVNETINYQFGFEVSRSWFYRLLGRALTPLVLFGIATLLGISSIVVVAPHEQAVILRMGEMAGDPVGPGMHFKLPWPLGRVEKYPVLRVHQFIVGSSIEAPEEGKAVLWTNQHAGQEEYMITAPTPYEGQAATEPGAEGRKTASESAGMSLTGAQVVVQYTVKDLKQLVRNAPYPHEMLTATHPGFRREAAKVLVAPAERRVNAYFASHTIDHLLGSGAVAAAEALHRQIQDDYDRAGLGIQVLLVSLSGVHPPQEKVAPSFLQQIGVRQERQTTIEKAKAEAIKTLAEVAGSYESAQKIHDAILQLERLKDELAATPSGDAPARESKNRQRIVQEVELERLLMASRGEAARLILEARAERWARAIDEHTQAILFQAEAKAYRNAPQVYVLRKYLEAQEEALGAARTIVLGSKSTAEPVVRLRLPDPTGKLNEWLQKDD